MMKVKMKVSGAFRTFKGATDFAALRSVVATARKQGCNILQTLTAHPRALTLSLPASPPPGQLPKGLDSWPYAVAVGQPFDEPRARALGADHGPPGAIEWE